jgi:riboflavin synthase
MFTGLIESTGTVVKRTTTSGGLRLRIESQLAAGLHPGDSLAVNGVCLTAVTVGEGEIEADISPETIRVTTLGGLAPGTLVNLERPVRADGRLGGHFVQGHVDGTGTVVDRRAQAEFEWVTFGFPAALAPYLVHKGSIAVDGVSLTVAELGAESFGVQIVPFTLERTNLGRLEAGTPVNLECDLLGKYVARALQLVGLTLQEAQ